MKLTKKRRRRRGGRRGELGGDSVCGWGEGIRETVERGRIPGWSRQQSFT